MKTLISCCVLLLLTTAVTGFAAEPAKWGYIDTTGKLVIPARFETAQPFSEGLALIRTEKNGKWGFLDTVGKMVIPPQFETAGSFSDGLAVVLTEKQGQYGYIDKTGTVVIPPQYAVVKSFSEGLAAVRKKDSKWGYIDRTGTMVIPPQFVYATPFSDGLARIGASGGYGYIDKTGKLVIPPQIGFADSFVNGRAAIQLGEKSGYIDKTGKAVIPPQFANGWLPFSDGMAPVLLEAGGGWGYINTTGKAVIAPQFERAGFFTEGLAPVSMGGRFGFVDKTGNLVIRPRFADVGAIYDGAFSEGFARVRIEKDGLWGYIDKTGTVVIPPQFARAEQFSGGLAAVLPGVQEQVSQAGGAERAPGPRTAPREPIAPPDTTGRSIASTSELSEGTQSRILFSAGLGGNLFQLLVLVMGVMTGVRGSLSVTGSWTITGWSARVIGWSFVLAAAGSLSLPGLVMAPDFEPPTKIEALTPVLGPYLFALAVTAAVLFRARKHHGSAG